MIEDFFSNLLYPRVASSTTELIVYVVLAIVLTVLIRYVLAWILVLTRAPFYGKDKVWTTESVIHDTKVWAGLLTILLLTSVVAYCVLSDQYEQIRALIPYGAALVVAFVLTGVSLTRLNRPVSRYRELTRG
jgi:hypothetical protein